MNTFEYPYKLFEEKEDFDYFAEDANFYVIDSQPYEENNWNHGVFTYVATNEHLGKVLFLQKCDKNMSENQNQIQWSILTLSNTSGSTENKHF